MSLRSLPSRERALTRPSAHRRSDSSSSANDQVAKLYLEIAQLFMAYGKPHVARRRLKFVIEQCGDSQAAVESRNLLEAIEARQVAAAPPPGQS